jgi:prepilin-type N-terminal cleavage/methylation domain-containing protein
MKKYISNNKGFTLIELIVSVAILGFIVVGFLNVFVYGTTYLGMARDKSNSSTFAISDANTFMSDESGSDITTANITLSIELISGEAPIVVDVTEVTVNKTKDGQASKIVTIIP